MKNSIFIIIILFLLEIIFSSCDLDKTGYRVYHKCYFLGEDSFTIKGKIYDQNGQDMAAGEIGKNIYAKAPYYYSSGGAAPDWEIKSLLNGNNFEFQIGKTSDNGLVLESDSSVWFFHTDYDFKKYFDYYSIPFDPEREARVFYLIFELDDGSKLKEYESYYTGLIDENFDYVYVTKPENITGRIQFKDVYGDDQYWFYDCNFEKAGWYKICTFRYHTIGSNNKYPSYSSSKNIKLRKPIENMY